MRVRTAADPFLRSSCETRESRIQHRDAQSRSFPAPDFSFSQQLAQTRISTEILETRFGVTAKAFAFPQNDDEVQDEFFAAVFSEPLLDASFGRSGLVPHFHPRNIERVSMEKTSAPARQILARQFTRATYFRLRPERSVGHSCSLTSEFPPLHNS